MDISINPGSGPVKGGTKGRACINVRALAQDVHERYPEVSVRVPEQEPREVDGRWEFTIDVTKGERTVTLDVEMPGLLLREVRYLGLSSQNIWDFPRLYVDGSSWVWNYAISAIGSHPFEVEDD